MFEGIGEIEDFRNGKWPFGLKGKPEDVPAPSGAVYKNVGKLMGQVGRRAGEYSFGGEADTLPAMLGLVIDGVGAISVPMNEQQAQVLGDNALLTPELSKSIDGKAPKSWDLQPKHFRIQNPAWHSNVSKLVEDIATRLGYEGISVECKLRKLLIHGEGGGFIHPLDAKTEGDLVATLMVQLPSVYEGGDLAIYHEGNEKKRHDLGKTQSKRAYLPHYVAISSGAEFQLEKVTTGYRMVLVYDVVLPPNLPQLENVSTKPVSEDLAASIDRTEPDDGSFALLLSNSYSSKMVEELGFAALKGIDSARFHALQQANTFAPDDKKLRFFIVKLTHQINYDGDSYDWSERNRNESSTWYSASGEKIGHVECSSQPLNFLNPKMETLSEMWIPRSKVVEEGCLGYRGGRKVATYSGFALIAWPAHQHYENALAFKLLDAAAEALMQKRPIDASTLRTLWETVLKEREAAWQAFLRSSCQLPATDMSVRFSRAFCELLLDADDLSLLTTFLLEYCPRLGGPNGNETLVPVLTRIIGKFDWKDIESAVLDLVIKPPLREKDHFPKADVEATLQVVDGLSKGTAEQALLPQVVENALKLETDELLSPQIINLLWKSVIHFGDKDILEAVASKYGQIDPGRLGPIVGVFEQYKEDLASTDEGLAVLKHIVIKRVEWLKERLNALDQPFSWRMPDAEFPDTTKVQAFLRGSDAAMTLTSSAKRFKGFQSARNYAAKWTREKQVNASFEMEASSTDGNAIVTITKTRKWFMECQLKLRQYKAELAGIVETFDGYVDDYANKRARLN